MQRLTLRQWLPLLGITTAAFIFNTSEFMPIGLLTSIADSFAISESTAGIMITVYSWSVMILSLPLMILASRISYRPMLLAVLAVFASGQVLSGIASSYVTLVLARILVASAHAIFWSVATVIAVQLVDVSHRDLAMSMVVTGSSLAQVCGLPLGRIIGLTLGWRMTFITVGIVAISLFVFQFIVFPRLGRPEPFRLNRLPILLHNRPLVTAYIIAALFMTGYYTPYSYIEPFLQDVAGISAGLITMILSLFGIAGLFGSVAFSMFYERNHHRFMLFSLTSLAVVLILVRPSVLSLVTLLAICAYWGFSGLAYNVAAQSEIILHSGQDGAVAMSIFSSLCNLGIGMGSFLGGQTVDHLGIDKIGFVGAILAVLAVVVCIYSHRREEHR